MSASPFPILPEGTSLVPGGLDSLYGAVIISIIISAYLLGILTVQVYLYYGTFKDDPTFIKVVVGLIFDSPVFPNVLTELLRSLLCGTNQLRFGGKCSSILSQCFGYSAVRILRRFCLYVELA